MKDYVTGLIKREKILVIISGVFLLLAIVIFFVQYNAQADKSSWQILSDASHNVKYGSSNSSSSDIGESLVETIENPAGNGQLTSGSIPAEIGNAEDASDPEIVYVSPDSIPERVVLYSQSKSGKVFSITIFQSRNSVFADMDDPEARKYEE